MKRLAFSLFWLFWVLAGVVVELVAVFNKQKGDTLSEHVWKYVTGRKHPTVVPKSAAWIGRLAIAAFLLWVGPHFIFGIWS